MADVSLENVTKRFGNVVAVDGINLDVEDRELLVLVGPSGCGKTTTLRMIAGLEDVTDGLVRIGDRVVNDLAPRKRDVAMVFQHFALYPHLNVYRNMAFGLRMRRTPKAETERRVRETARILGIEELLERRPAQLSGGQRQRVSLGRAIVREPQLFLFDEPLSNLDAQLRVSMRRELVKLQRQLETTMIHVTHDQVEAMTMGGRIAVMNGGRILQTGRPEQIYERPANRFVAQFFGNPPMNLLNGILKSIDGAPLVDVGGLLLSLPKASLGTLQPWVGKPVTLGFRPEAIAFGGGQDGGWTRLRAEVLATESMGGDTLLYLQHGGSQFAASQRPRTDHRPGELIDVFIDPCKCLVFDAESGDAIPL